MDLSTIAAMSIGINQVQLQQDVGVAVLKKAMEVQEVSAEGLSKLLPPPATEYSFGTYA